MNILAQAESESAIAARLINTNKGLAAIKAHKEMAKLDAQIVFASGSKGLHVRADGNGGTLARGYYIRSITPQFGGGTMGPYPSRRAARQALKVGA